MTEYNIIERTKTAIEQLDSLWINFRTRAELQICHDEISRLSHELKMKDHILKKHLEIFQHEGIDPTKHQLWAKP